MSKQLRLLDQKLQLPNLKLKRKSPRSLVKLMPKQKTLKLKLQFLPPRRFLMQPLLPISSSKHKSVLIHRMALMISFIIQICSQLKIPMFSSISRMRSLEIDKNKWIMNIEFYEKILQSA